jgi:HD-GYP domain-containing protein (c-di-GMP phosphodiesterase class II)
MNVKTDKNRHLYNSRIIDTFIKLIKSKYSYVNIGELLSYANMKPYEVADQGHWFSQEQVDRFYERLVNVTKNENIAREAGRYSASPDAIGVMRQYVLGMVSPAMVYELIGKTSANFTLSSSYESHRLSSNKIEIVVTPHDGVTERQFQCENRMGFFEAIVDIYRNKLPTIEHPECMFTGGNVCRYVISWEKTAYAHWKKIRNFSLPLLAVVNVVLITLRLWTALDIVLPASIAVFLLLTLIAVSKEKDEMKASLNNTRDSIDKLVDQININYNNALMTNEIGLALSRHTNSRDILASVIQIMEKRLDYDRGLILLADANRTKLELEAGYGYSDELLGLFDKVSFHLDRPESKGMFVVSYREQRPFLINDLNDVQETLSARSLTFARKLGAQSFICCPIICEDKSMGVVAVDNVKSKRPLVQSDMSLLMGIASVIGISLRNAEHSEARVRQFNSVLQVLAASIDARDSLTAGHSEKVTEYALGICKELGLSWEYSEMIRVAALLHDYGKIGVPDAILKKEGRLTEEEYEIVKTHSGKTREILLQIHFEGIYCEVPDIAGSHHEKVDGTGYPRGIKGKDIPLGAKIIAVADYFEAVTAKRHYRDPMPLDEAFLALRGEIGKHFEKRFVEALIKYYTRTYLYNSPESDASQGQRGPRAPFRTDVSLRCNGKVTSCVSEDIGAGGMFVVADDHATEGLPVELVIQIPTATASPIEARGRIAWINNKSQPKKPSFPSGYGVQFLEFKEPAGEAFLNFITSYIPANCSQGFN